jgi:transposase-like protein
VFTPLLKQFLEEALDGELETHIEEEEAPNRINGKGRKQVKTPVGNIVIATPRYRNGTFEPEMAPEQYSSRVLLHYSTYSRTPCS